MPAALVTPVLIGAAVGAVSAAVSGGNVLKGALFGALGGGIGGAISGALGGAAGSTGASVVAGETGATAGAAAGQAAGAGSTMFGVVGSAGEAAGYGIAEGMGGSAAIPAAEAAGSVGEAAGTGLAASVDGAVGTGLQQAAGTGLATTTDLANATAAGGSANWPVVDAGSQFTGVSAPAANTGLSAGVVPPNPFAGGGAAAGQPRTFLQSLFTDGSSMINSRLGTTMAGEVLKGYAAGKNQEALLDARRQDVRDARANARFGNLTSRYNTASMVGPVTYK